MLFEAESEEAIVDFNQWASTDPELRRMAGPQNAGMQIVR
jgi:hypothetical protein